MWWIAALNAVLVMFHGTMLIHHARSMKQDNNDWYWFSCNMSAFLFVLLGASVIDNIF
jgi:hypothetical protein